jgi:hypothetical protein
MLIGFTATSPPSSHTGASNGDDAAVVGAAACRHAQATKIRKIHGDGQRQMVGSVWQKMVADGGGKHDNDHQHVDPQLETACKHARVACQRNEKQAQPQRQEHILKGLGRQTGQQ